MSKNSAAKQPASLDFCLRKAKQSSQEFVATAEQSNPLFGQRLLKDRRALISLWVLVSLMLAAIFGPLVWQQSPSQQWLSHISTGPALGIDAEIVDIEDTPLQAVDEFEAVVSNTEQVFLVWPNNGKNYRIYRHNEALPEPGIPLGTSNTGWYSDQLQLRAEPWVYTLIADDNEQLSLKVTPRPAISVFEAKLQGLIPENLSDQQAVGQHIRLPAHPLGTDQLGRDMFARILEGARTSLFVGIVAPLLFIFFGTVYGALAGLLGGVWDDLMMRFADFVVGLPLLLFMILFRVLFGFEAGDSGVTAIIVAMLLLSWPSSARLVRGQVLQMREQPFVQSARLSGASNLYLIRHHLVPNLLPLLLVSLSFAIPQAIFTEAFLSFIGLGVSPPTASWGSLCNEGIKTLLTHPHELVFPALMISITVLAFNSLGESLRDAVDVKGRDNV